MFCTKCGSEIPDGNKFCTECGAPIEAAATAGGVMGATSDYSAPVEPVEPAEAVNPVEPAASADSNYTQSYENYSSDNSANYATNNTYDYSANNGFAASAANEVDPELAKMGHSTMVTGIVAAALTSSVFLSFIGVIVGIVGLVKASKTKKAGYRKAKVHVGFGLSLYSVIAGIFISIYMAFYLALVIFAISNGA